jgi:hypothetical protein
MPSDVPARRVFSRNRALRCRTWLCIGVSATLVSRCAAGTLIGHVRDPNWFATYQSNPPGVGYYEYAVNANGAGLSSLGGADDTDVFGVFQMNDLPAGSYTAVSWDVWWRSAYAFGVSVATNGPTPDVDLRLRATMWGYPAFWDDTGYYEFGQTFVATGPVTMIYLRVPFSTAYTLTVHEAGPGGPQIGVSRTFNGGDRRPIYGYGEMPTIAGKTYYVRIRTAAPSIGGVIRLMDPRPDYSDPMPGGCLWLGDTNGLVAHPGRDLGLIIMSDDDGLITNLYTRHNSTLLSGEAIGQTFVARGVNLISAAVWLADPSYPNYVVRVLAGGTGGAQVGTAKRGRVARSGDPEMLVAWAPGECPLTPGQTYFLEVTRDGGGTIYAVLANATDPFAYGDACTNGVMIAGTDLAGTLMEEEAPGSATRPQVRFLTEPAVPEMSRGSNQLMIQWTTDVAADALVEYAPLNPPYTRVAHGAVTGTNHAVILSNLHPHLLYHFRVTSAATNCRPAVSRDLHPPVRLESAREPGVRGRRRRQPAQLLSGLDRVRQRGHQDLGRELVLGIAAALGRLAAGGRRECRGLRRLRPPAHRGDSGQGLHVQRLGDHVDAREQHLEVRRLERPRPAHPPAPGHRSHRRHQCLRRDRSVDAAHVQPSALHATRHHRHRAEQPSHGVHPHDRQRRRVAPLWRGRLRRHPRARHAPIGGRRAVNQRRVPDITLQPARAKQRRRGLARPAGLAGRDESGEHHR